jgi:WD40 repeat protein
MTFRKRLNQDVNRHVIDFFSSGKYVVSGNHDGTVSVWDTCASSDVILPCHMTYVAHNDCVNGIRYSALAIMRVFTFYMFSYDVAVNAFYESNSSGVD